MSSKTAVCCSECGEERCLIVKFKNLLPWAKNTGCESQWFGGDGKKWFVPLICVIDASAPAGVMQPGTSTLWARHTQETLFLKWKRAKKKKKTERKLDTTEPNDQEKKIQF